MHRGWAVGEETMMGWSASWVGWQWKEVVVRAQEDAIGQAVGTGYIVGVETLSFMVACFGF